MKLIKKLVLLFFIGLILSTFDTNSNASIFKFKFEELEKAQKLYPSDPKGAHEILDKLIIHYEKKPPKDFPWLAYAYGDKANWLRDEGKNEESIDFRIKSCELHQKNIEIRR